jgi:hypothetical protein
MGKLNRDTWICALVTAIGVSALFLWSGFRNLHHYDEFAYLYAAAHYSIPALANGQFEPSNVPGFLNVKIGHLMLLKLLVNWFGIGMTLIRSAEAAYTALVFAACGIYGMIAYYISNNARRAMGMGAAALVIPINVYLAPKLLGEVPGMFSAMASFLFFVLALRGRNIIYRGCFLVVSALALAFTLLARQNLILVCIGGWAGLWVARPMRFRRRDIFVQAAIVAVLCAIALVASQWFIDMHLLRGLNLAHDLEGLRISRSLRLMRTIYAFGPFLLMVPFALFSQHKREMVFYCVWFSCNVVPMLIGFHYIEERFVVGGAPALAGLAVMGGEVIWRLLGSPRRLFAKVAGLLTIAVVVMASNNFIQPRTIHEVDETAYAQVMDWLNKTYPDRPILIPWPISDYHYLRIAYPDAPVYLVNTSVFFGPLRYAHDPQSWDAALKKWYRNRYVGNYEALENLSPPPWILVTRKEGDRDTIHWTWLQSEPRVQMKLVLRAGWYQVYQVHGNSLSSED